MSGEGAGSASREELETPPRSGLLVAAVVALAVAGVGIGWVLSVQDRAASSGSGVADPIGAEAAQLPVDAPEPYAEDPDDDPLQPGIALTTARLGTGRFMITFPVPEGWRSNDRATNEAKWKEPGTANNSYVMRIELIASQDVTVEQAVQTRVDRLTAEQDDFEPGERGPGALEYTYRSDEGNARHSFMRWVDVDEDGRADVEIVVHGREEDVPGTRDLVARVADGLRGA